MNIKNLTMSFGLQEIFNDVSLQIKDKEKVGIIGVNGAGKSTLFKLILSFNLLFAAFKILLILIVFIIVLSLPIISVKSNVLINSLSIIMFILFIALFEASCFTYTTSLFPNVFKMVIITYINAITINTTRNLNFNFFINFIINYIFRV